MRKTAAQVRVEIVCATMVGLTVPVVLPRCPGCQKRYVQTFGRRVSPRDSSYWASRYRPRSSHLVALPCCLWTGLVSEARKKRLVDGHLVLNSLEYDPALADD
jgi:hypothetical protein